YGGLEESISHVDLAMPVHWTFFGEKPKATSFVARLSPNGRSQLQGLLSESHGWKTGFDARGDVCPQTGDYACSTCFYSGLTVDVPRKTVQEKAVFGPCPKCGEEATWVKMIPRPVTT